MNRIIKGSQIVADIREGMKPYAIMRKYGLSSQELKSLYRQIRFEQEARVAAIVADIVNGVPHLAIMKKHQISSGTLEKLLRTASIVPAEQLPSSAGRRDTIVDEVTVDFRSEPRHKPMAEISAYDHRGRVGDCFLRDISERGLSLAGTRTEIHETCEVAILGDDSGLVSPFELKAECRWRYDVESTGRPMAGFRITMISPANLNRLWEFIENHTNYTAE